MVETIAPVVHATATFVTGSPFASTVPVAFDTEQVAPAGWALTVAS